MAVCPKCGTYRKKKAEVISHIEDAHKDDIPEGWSPAKYYYAMHHDGKPTGTCRVCGTDTPFIEETGKPLQLCRSKACSDTLRRRAEENLLKKRGITKSQMMNDPEHQMKMLANRKISGEYKWSDGSAVKSYVGSYELTGVEFLDIVMNLPSQEVMMPGPTLPYKFKGQDKFYITDIYLPTFNVIIEIKDGDTNPNTHPGFAENKEKEKAKDEMMRKQNQYHYIKLTNKNMLPLMRLLTKIKMDNLSREDKHHNDTYAIINENSSILLEEGLDSFTPREDKSNLYMLIFNEGKKANDVALSIGADLKNIFINENGTLIKTDCKHESIKDKSAILMEFVGDVNSALLESVLSHEYNIDKEILPDSFHITRELLQESGYCVTESQKVTMKDFLDTGDFQKVTNIDKLDNYDYDLIIESITLDATDDWTDAIYGVLTEGASKKLEKIPLTTKEREEVKNRFGKIACSIFKNGQGQYFATTHRARSKFFDTLQKMPIKTVRFISSTS